MTLNKEAIRAYARHDLESHKFVRRYLEGNFLDVYLSGQVVLDIGPAWSPLFPHAIGIDQGYPGYDGLHLPFGDASADAVFSSHCLEHVIDPIATLREWYRVLKEERYLVILVPHQFLYEKRRHLPSVWNGDHKRFYTPRILLEQIEEAFAPNSYRIRHLADGDFGFDYRRGPTTHSSGSYDIEIVVQKIRKPEWELA